MENRFKDLLIDNKDRLPKPWYDYHVHQQGQYDTLLIYSEGREFIKIHVGLQDSVWTASHSYWVGNTGNTSNPGRKWGEFASKDDAILYRLGEVLVDLQTADRRTPAAIRAVEQKIQEIRFDKLQLKLF